MTIKPGKSDGRISRRSAMGSGMAVAAGLATCLPAVADEFGKPASGTGPLAYSLPEEYWANMVGEFFRVLGYAYDDRTEELNKCQLKLVETALVIPSGFDVARPLYLRKHAISLLFRGSLNIDLVNASYRMQHRWLGEFEIYLSPTRSKRYKRHNIFEAIINT